jgi:hypothetical protein
MNRQVLRLLLKQSFEGSTDERRVVARAAGDLADSGRYRADKDASLTPQVVVENLSDASDDHDLVERWNWWMGALDTAHGGYGEFLVRRLPGEEP